MTVESTVTRGPRKRAAAKKTPGGQPDLVQLLTPEGKRVRPTKALAEYAAFVEDITPEELRGLYRDMVLTRRFDAEATSLQRQGELGLWASLLGQEAAQIGSGRATRPDDYVFPTYREHGVAWTRGVDPTLLLGMFRGSTTAAGTPPPTTSTCTRSSSARRPCTPPATPWASPRTARTRP